jgi:S-formylglutathione hydrolase FrmB
VSFFEVPDGQHAPQFWKERLPAALEETAREMR